MIETLKYANISKIYVKNLFYFDNENIDSCINFCNKFGITHLPSKQKDSIFEYSGDGFILKKLGEIQTILPSDLIFNLSTLEKFNNDTDNVLFVVENNEIIGVVHITDYQNEFVYFELYKLIFRFEKMLRDFLISKGQNNDTFLEYVELKSQKGDKDSLHYQQRYKEYKKFLDENRLCGQFQGFYLGDLINFCNSKKYVKLDSNSINKVRNFIAHNKEIINTEKDSFEGKFYNFTGLKQFIKFANCFFDNFKQLELAYADAIV